jgi:hypothetical protein
MALIVNLFQVIKLLALPSLLLLPAVAEAQFNFTTNNGTLAIAQYTGPGGLVVIPDTTNGLPVTSIGPGAFENCFTLTGVTVGTNVANIGSDAFENCYSLAGITIPDSVTNIGDNAFNYCYNMTDLTIGANVTSIGEDAFYECASLNSVAIPGSVTNLGEFSFGFCYSLTSVTIGAGSPNSGQGGVGIGESAFFECASLATLTLGANVTSIAGEAFVSCTNLASVTIPGSVTNIGIYAFSGCFGLTNALFLGNAPGGDSTVFAYDADATVYYLPVTTGWGAFYGGVPTWNPQIRTGDGSFGVQNDQFRFDITGNSNLIIVVQASTNPAGASWIPVSTNTLTNGSCHFSDPQWKNYPSRFYRLSP